MQGAKKDPRRYHGAGPTCMNEKRLSTHRRGREDWGSGGLLFQVAFVPTVPQILNRCLTMLRRD
jgi:hypothetical protein